MRLYFKTHESIVARPRRVSLIRREYAEQDEEGEEEERGESHSLEEEKLIELVWVNLLQFHFACTYP